MTEQLKELIEHAPIKRQGQFRNFLVVSNGEYDGTWGKNGYDSILLLGFDDDLEKYVKITDYADKLDIFKLGEFTNFNLDIPHEYGVPRIWFNRNIYIDNGLDISSICGEVVEREVSKT